MNDHLPEDWLEWRAMAKAASLAAGHLLRQQWSRTRKVKRKGYRDYVTESDLAAQKTITDLIQQTYPEHGFLAEETDSNLPEEGDVLWIIDPIDGTSNFSRSQPNFCVSVAAASKFNEQSIASGGTAAQEPYQSVAAAVFDPMRDELFSAARGAGATLNGRPIKVSVTHELEEAIVGLDWSRHRAKRQAMIEALTGFGHHVHTIRAVGSAVLALAWIAAGRLDVYCNLGVGAWDVAAGALLIEEAGGSVSNLNDTRWQLGDVGCLASNGGLDPAFRKVAGWTV